ncbi:hypothetical protein SAMN04487950_0223 [Halogranum rubrum]|uniref:LURP-one-related n=2 Tax=Halogranum rubrum TaxID=553466 RepID=A0A1I4B0D7_9EURY|nr:MULTISPECIES: hypothetical protein [Halogranum]EJN58193.1 hypothetical protein HSB1_36100 [Halogranum salarium B-1]SFK62225.1 hypothetical protein SAMN04487950_0223 [Halogranum rubrum]
MFDASRYEVRQKLRIGNKYNVYEGDENILESAQKKFRLKEDFRFNDPETGEERFRVKADSVLDVAASYDIVDSRTGDRIGSVKRSVKSFFKHEYALVDASGSVVATVKEDGWLRAILRRNLTTLIPFSYDIEGPSGEHFGDVSEKFTPVRDKYTIDLSGDGQLDPRLVVIGTVVIDAIEEN